MVCLVAAVLRNYCAEKRSMRTKLAVFDNPVTSHKNFVLMWETDTSGQVSGDVLGQPARYADSPVMNEGGDDFLFDHKF